MSNTIIQMNATSWTEKKPKRTPITALERPERRTRVHARRCAANTMTANTGRFSMQLAWAGTMRRYNGERAAHRQESS